MTSVLSPYRAQAGRPGPSLDLAARRCASILKVSADASPGAARGPRPGAERQAKGAPHSACGRSRSPQRPKTSRSKRADQGKVNLGELLYELFAAVAPDRHRAAPAVSLAKPGCPRPKCGGQGSVARKETRRWRRRRLTRAAARAGRCATG